MGIVGPRIDPQGELGVCVFLWGHRIFALQRSSAYDMGKSNRFGMEIRERNNLFAWHGLYCFLSFLFISTFLFKAYYFMSPRSRVIFI